MKWNDFNCTTGLNYSLPHTNLCDQFLVRSIIDRLSAFLGILLIFLPFVVVLLVDVKGRGDRETTRPWWDLRNLKKKWVNSEWLKKRSSYLTSPDFLMSSFFKEEIASMFSLFGFRWFKAAEDIMARFRIPPPFSSVLQICKFFLLSCR